MNEVQTTSMLVTKSEATKILGVTRKTMWVYLQMGKLKPSIVLDGRIPLFERSYIENLRDTYQLPGRPGRPRKPITSRRKNMSENYINNTTDTLDCLSLWVSTESSRLAEVMSVAMGNHDGALNKEAIAKLRAVTSRLRVLANQVEIVANESIVIE